MNDITWLGWTNKLSNMITLNKKLWFSKISRKQKSHADMDEPLSLEAKTMLIVEIVA